MTKKSTTLPVEDDGRKFDAKVSYEISAGKTITITSVEDDKGKPFELTDEEKQELAAKLLGLHPDHELPPELCLPDNELPPEPATKPVDPDAPEIDQSLPPVHPGEPTQPLPVDPITGVPLPVDPGSPQPLPFPPGTPTDPVTGKPAPLPRPGQRPDRPTEDIANERLCPACGQRLPLTIAEQLGN